MVYRFNAIPIKISMAFKKIELEQRILKFLWKHNTPQITKTILRKNKTGDFALPDLKLYYKTTVIQTVWHCHRNRQISGTDQGLFLGSLFWENRESLILRE